MFQLQEMGLFFFPENKSKSIHIFTYEGNRNIGEVYWTEKEFQFNKRNIKNVYLILQ